MDSCGISARTPQFHSRKLSYSSPASEEQQKNPTHKKNSLRASILQALLYGFINAIILVPVMIRIIFHDPLFQPAMPDLVKLVIISGAIHQICFSCLSSLPFAVGQVQDAGLIFLSAMASSVVSQLTSSSSSSPSLNEILATTLFTLAISTAVLGIALIVTGKLKLASFVQYLPMPVVGGYLAYIGFYCLEAGLSMMSGKSILHLSDWPQLFDLRSVMLISPGVVCGLIILYVTLKINHFAVLPSCLLCILMLFYITLFSCGYSLEDARDGGWIDPLPNKTSSILDIYSHYKISLVHWSTLPSQLPTWIAMYFVVAFSSSLDVAAIEMDAGSPLDHNHELQTVGMSNLLSGCTGGFTGSYIFSQTIFNMRNLTTDSRLTGFIIVFLELVIVSLPFSLISYVPKMFFGSLLTLIAVDLLLEWLLHARKTMLKREYAILWLTFLSINVTNLEVGIILGIIFAAFNFIVSYASSNMVQRVVKSSRVERHHRERKMLEKARLGIVVLELEGYIFFGSSVQIMREVRKHVLIPGVTPGVIDPVVESTPLLQTSDANKSVAISVHDVDDHLLLGTLDDEDDQFWTRCSHGGDKNNFFAVPTKFFILDFDRVRGIDATSVRNCFNATKKLLEQHGISLLYAGLPDEMADLFRRNGVVKKEDDKLLFTTLDDALEYSEDELVKKIHQSESARYLQSYHTLKLSNGLTKIMEKFLPHLTPRIGFLFEDYFDVVEKEEGQILYHAGSSTDGIYFVEAGTLDVFIPSEIMEGMGPGFKGSKRIKRQCAGGVLGELDLHLRRKRAYSVVTISKCILIFLSKEKYLTLQNEEPQIASKLQTAMLHSLAFCVLDSHFYE